MNGRARVVLSRFPAHLDAAREGKQLGVVAEAVARELDELSAALAGIRRAHRIGDADALVDVRRLGALLRVRAEELAPLDRRVTILAAAGAELRQALDAAAAAVAAELPPDLADIAARDAAAERICDLLAIAGPAPRLALFAPPPAPPDPDAPPGPPPGPDLAAAGRVLAAALAELTGYRGRREAVRARIRALAGIHARGNGTVATLLEATASILDLELDEARTRTFKETLRPVVTVAPQGTPGATLYAYVVVARSRSKNVDRLSAVAATAAGNAVLSPAASILVSWSAPPDVRDFLVFRVVHGADPAAIGLLTPTALAADTTSFTDVGQAPTEVGPLDPELDDALFHSRDRFWHAAFVRERAPLRPGAESACAVVGLEENPVRREETPDTPRAHAACFPVYRRGFGRAQLRIRITGLEDDRCVGPMLVNRDEGRGIGFAGVVPAGQTLTCDETGHALLGETDVTSWAYAWEGACFAGADDDPAAPHDFVFDGPGLDEALQARSARFARATPFDALDGGFTFPHGGEPLPVPGVGIGRTRFAFFVQQAHFSRDDGGDPPAAVPLSPRFLVGFLDAQEPDAPPGRNSSVFAPPPAAPPAASISLSWLEHEAYAVRVLLPRHYSLYDLEGERPLAELSADALERHRPAGVTLRVEYVDDRWVLGEGELAAGACPDPILSLRGGTVLWSPPAPTS